MALANTAFVVASDELQAFVCQLIEHHGLKEAARILGVGEVAATRICAGLRVRRGTIASVQMARAAQPSTPPSAA